MTKVGLAAIGAGLATSLLLALLVAMPGAAMFVVLTPLPLFLAGLAQGLGAALVAGATAGVILTALGGIVAALAAILSLIAPVCILVRQALLSRPGQDGRAVQWYPPGLLVTWLTGIGIAWLALAILLFVDGPEGIEGNVREHMAGSLTVLIPGAEPEQARLLAEALAPFALGMGLNSWLMVIAANGILAQGVLLRFSRNFRPSPDIVALDLPPWLAPALAVSAIVAFLASGDVAYVAQNLVLVLVLPFFFAGLAVLHAVGRRIAARVAFLVIVYAFLVLLGWPALLIAGLGLIEQWAGFRRRLAASHGREDE